jgi:hypothetical protein
MFPSKSDGQPPQGVSPKPPPNYFSRAVQTRLLVLVFLFMTVLMLMSEARNPEHYQWMWSLEQTPNGSSGRAVTDREDSTDELKGQTDSGSRSDSSQSQASNADRPPLLVSKSAMQGILDNRVLRPEEHDAWFEIWDRLLGADHANPSLPRPGNVSYTQLLAQPNEYRGRWISISGQARLGYYAPAAANEHELQGYYVIWLRVNDDLASPPEGSNNVLAIYCVDLPPGFPTLGQRDSANGATPLDNWMQFSGVLFKRWVYLSKRGPELVPLVLGRINHWEPVPVRQSVSQPPPQTWFVMVLFILATLIGLTVAGWVYLASRRPRRAEQAGNATPDALPVFDQGKVQAGVRESLRELSEEQSAEFHLEP